jgi:UDP-glucose:glycoprotein glucosyltransferase
MRFFSYVTVLLVWQADPGAWELSLRAGRSNDIYEIVSHENTDSDKDSNHIAVLVNRSS